MDTPFNYFLPLLILNFVLPFMKIEAKTAQILNRTIGIILIVSFAAVLISIIKIAEDYVYHHYDITKQDNLREKKTTHPAWFSPKYGYCIGCHCYSLCILLSFESLRRVGTGLLTAVGIGGIIIGFAAQRSLGNLLAGLQLAFTQPIRIDDALLIEGEWGKVEEITLTYVVVKIWDERRLILPINYFIEKPFQNWTRTGSELLGTVSLFLDYTAPLEIL